MHQTDLARSNVGSDEDTNREQLANAQEYLRVMLQKVAPDFVLCHAWDEFYRFYDRLTWRFVHHFGLRQDQAENCVQEVWVFLAEKLKTFHHNGNRHGFRSWLLRGRPQFARQSSMTGNKNCASKSPGASENEPNANRLQPSRCRTRLSSLGCCSARNESTNGLNK